MDLLTSGTLSDHHQERAQHAPNLGLGGGMMKKVHLIGTVAILALTGEAHAQTSNVAQASAPEQASNPATEGAQVTDDIVVTGIRASLRSSQAIKRSSSQIVDAVSAEDVGKFPDVNIAESLQRVTGVAIDRNGGEGQFITVRGLGPQFNTVLVNGRIMATDNAGREFSFDVLSPNMIQRTDVYKSTVPQLQEGGIGATVNVITAKPLDGKSGLHATVAAGGMYDTLRSKLSPDLSGVVSATNDEKTVGFVLSAAYSNRFSQNDQFLIHGWLPGSQGIITGDANSTGLDAGALANSPPGIFTPRDSTFNRSMDQRQRINVASAFQAQLTSNLLLTVDGLYSQFDVRSKQNTFGVYYTPRFIDLAYNDRDTVTGFNRPGSNYLAANPRLTDPALADQRVTLSQNDNYVATSDRFTSSYQLGVNLAWNAADNLVLKLDASRTEARNRTPNTFTVVGELAQTTSRWDLTPENDIPTVSNLGPIDDASLMRAHYISVGEGRVRDKGSEYHADGEYKVDRNLIRSVIFGLSYNERRKTRTNRDNGDRCCEYTGYEVPIPTDLLSPYTLDNWLNGASGSGGAPTSFFDFNPNDIYAYLSRPDVLAIPRQGRTAAEQAEQAQKVLALGGPFALLSTLR